MPRSSTVRYTYRDHRSIPEDHRRHEIIDGVLYVTALPRVNHQVVAGCLLRILGRLAEEHDLGMVIGPVTVHLADEQVFEPDLVFIPKQRLDIADPEGDVHGPPDLVIEVLSPKSTEPYDRNVKRKRFLELGVPEVWLVDIDRREVQVWRRDVPQPEIVTDALPWTVAEHRLEIPLAEVFRGVR